MSREKSTGSDRLGAYKRTSMVWAKAQSRPILEIAIRAYKSFVVFETSFPQGVEGCTTNSTMIPSSVFPSWNTSEGILASEPGSLWWSGFGSGEAGIFKNTPSPPPPVNQSHYRPHYNFNSEYIGGFLTNAPVKGTPYGTSIGHAGTNLAVFDKDQSLVIIQSSLTSFGSVMMTRNIGGPLQSGVLGTIKQIPVGHSFESIAVFGSEGINIAYESWGSLLLSTHNKSRTPQDASVVLSHLGFSTTGSYFYSPEGASGKWPNLVPGKSFENTIIDVYKYAQKLSIPYRSVLLDSWWYGEYDHNGSGMYSWDENSAKEADPLDPKGRFPNGLKNLSAKVGGTLGMGNFIQHMGRWRADTHYVTNPEWDWRVYPRANLFHGVAWTNSQKFYDSLFSNATDWGLAVAKHDHVDEQLTLTPPALEEVGYAESVLTAELRALEKSNATMMAGGYTLMGWLNGVTNKALTHTRVASDYACWFNASTDVGNGCRRGMNGNYWSFNVGPPSLLSWALGMYPYKDTFLTSNRPNSRGPTACIGNNCLLANATEPYPWVHAVAASLSAGPIAPGDLIGSSNVSLILQTCRQDGTLLKPDRPATPLDAYWTVRAFGASASGPKGELWTTESTIPAETSSETYMYAFGTMLDERYDLSIVDLVKASSSWRDQEYLFSRQSQQYVAFNVAKGVNSAQFLDMTASLTFDAGIDYGHATYYAVAPVLSNGWTVLGEVDKLIPVSRQRLQKISVVNTEVEVVALGTPGEVVNIFAIFGAGNALPFSCRIDASTKCVIRVGTTKHIGDHFTDPNVNLASWLVPQPQSLQLDSCGVTVSTDPGWVITTDLNIRANEFAANDFAKSLLNITKGIRYNVLDVRAVGPLTGKYILFGTANNSIIKSALEQRNASFKDLGSKNGPEAYVLVIKDNAIIVGSSGAAGVFYGMQTLKQIWNASWILSNCTDYCSLPQVKILDYPELLMRGAHIHQLGTKYPSSVFYEQADRMAAHKMNFFSAMTTPDIPINLDLQAEFQLAMQKYVLDRHMEYVPNIALGVTQFLDDRTGEGIWAKDVPFIATANNSLFPVRPPIIDLPNAGFEMLNEDGEPANWTVLKDQQGPNVTYWSIDKSVYRSGSKSMKFVLDPSNGVSARLLSTKIVIEPRRTYQLSAFVFINTISGDEPYIWLVQLDNAGNEITHLPTGAEISGSKNIWTQLTCTFKADDDATAFYVYIGRSGNTTETSNLWIDDIMIINLDSALANIIRTNFTDVVVRPFGTSRNDSSTLYKLGEDYEILQLTSNVTTHPNFRNDTGASVLNPDLISQLRLIPTGRIKKGSNLTIDYDFQPGGMGFHTYDVWNGLPNHLPWPPNSTITNSPKHIYQTKSSTRSLIGSSRNDFTWSSPSASDFTDSLYYNIALNSTFALLEMFETRGTAIKYININYDELEAVARDSRSLRSGLTNGQLVAFSINRLVTRIKSRYPNISIMLWDDMLNAEHLHGPSSDQDNLQAQHYGREDGTLDTAMKLVNDTSIIWLNWFYDWPYSNERIKLSLQSTWDLGFRVIGCPNEDFLNIQCYSRVLQNNSLGIGMMDTDWDGKYLGVVRTASVAWHRIPNTTLDCTHSPLASE